MEAAASATSLWRASSSSWRSQLRAAAETAEATKAASESIPGLGSDLDEIKEKAREEGEVNIVQWAGYAQLTKEFAQETGCQVKTKDGATSDDMIQLISTGRTTASRHRATRAFA